MNFTIYKLYLNKPNYKKNTIEGTTSLSLKRIEVISEYNAIFNETQGPEEKKNVFLSSRY